MADQGAAGPVSGINPEIAEREADDGALQQARPVAAGSTTRDAAADVPATGDSRVDQAISSLGGLDGLPIADHAAVFDHVRERLQAVLGELDPGAPDR
jgi:hypothetical protein